MFQLEQTVGFKNLNKQNMKQTIHKNKNLTKNNFLVFDGTETRIDQVKHEVSEKKPDSYVMWNENKWRVAKTAVQAICNHCHGLGCIVCIQLIARKSSVNLLLTNELDIPIA